VLRINDDRGRELTFGAPPKRIVSLVPSDTYSVLALGAAGALVGRTDYCEHTGAPKIGGTKNPRLEAVLDLAPDLVLANQEENTRSDLEALVQRGLRVYVAFPSRVESGIAHLAKLARILGVERDEAARSLVRGGYEELRAAASARAAAPPLRVFCPIWMSPLMTIHGSTFISDMLDVCGAQTVFADRERRYPLAADLGTATALSGEAVAGRDVRYPRVTLDEVVARAPELVLLPDEPHPFTEEDAAVFRGLDLPASRRGAVVRASGKDVCWYGAWTVAALPRLRAMLAAHRR